jgi:hypothetical protein
MRKELRRHVTVVHPVNVRDRDPGQLLFRNSLEAADIDTEHLPDGRFVANAKRPDSTGPAEIVLVFSRVEQVLGKHFLSGNQPETDFSRDCRPEASSTANRAIASKRAL